MYFNEVIPMLYVKSFGRRIFMQILNGFLMSYYCNLIMTVFLGKQRKNAASKSIFVMFCNQTGNVRLLVCETGSFLYIEC